MGKNSNLLISMIFDLIVNFTKWCTLRELLGTIREGANTQVAEFIRDAEVVIFDFRT